MKAKILFLNLIVLFSSSVAEAVSLHCQTRQNVHNETLYINLERNLEDSSFEYQEYRPGWTGGRDHTLVESTDSSVVSESFSNESGLVLSFVDRGSEKKHLWFPQYPNLETVLLYSNVSRARHANTAYSCRRFFR